MAMSCDPGAPAGLAVRELSLPPFSQQTTAGPVVVAIEGPNGAGKTTLSRELSRKLGVPWCLGTDEAWFAEALKVRMIRDADWFASAMFFLSGCFEQMRLLQQQRDDRLVIMDRCLWSTLAVHGAEHVNRLQALIAMLRPIASQIRVPHLTLVLEASFATCKSRIAKKTGSARALDELTATAGFHAREREFYRWLGGQAPGVIFVDVEANAQEVAAKTVGLIKSKLGMLQLRSNRGAGKPR
jgi:thymidylate kinase